MSAITFFTPESFHHRPQTGRRDEMDWSTFVEWISTPMCHARKDAGGGWSSAHFVDDIRRKALVSMISGIGLDFDDGAALEQIADVVSRFRAVIHTTHSSSPAKPKHRLWLPFAEPMASAEEYDRVWRAIAAHFELRGLIVDRGTKDASRLWYVPVVHPDREFRVEVLEGEVLDPRKVLAAIPPEPKRQPIKVGEIKHADKYIGAALNKAARAIAEASEGARHDTLNREAYSLARLGLSDFAISSALKSTALAAMGPSREREIDRTISDAVAARGAA